MILEEHKRLRAYMKCKPINYEPLNLNPDTGLPAFFLSGLSLEPSPTRNYVVIRLKKAFSLVEFEDLLRWFHMINGRDIITVPYPGFEYGDCDPRANTVLEIIAPKVYGARVTGVRLSVPQRRYILSYDDLLSEIKELIRGRAAYVYVLSKYAQPGLLYRFMDAFSGVDHVKVYIASESEVLRRYGRTWASELENVSVIPTRSHRKLLLILVEDAGAVTAVGYRGSMNLFYPGVDDYLEAVNDWDDMQRLLHGLLRAFLIL